MWTLHCYEYKYLASGWEFIVWNFVFGFDIKFVFYALICNNPWIVGVYTFLNCLKIFDNFENGWRFEMIINFNNSRT